MLGVGRSNETGQRSSLQKGKVDRMCEGTNKEGEGPTC